MHNETLKQLYKMLNDYTHKKMQRHSELCSPYLSPTDSDLLCQIDSELQQIENDTEILANALAILHNEINEISA